MGRDLRRGSLARRSPHEPPPCHADTYGAASSPVRLILIKKSGHKCPKTRKRAVATKRGSENSKRAPAPQPTRSPVKMTLWGLHPQGAPLQCTDQNGQCGLTPAGPRFVKNEKIKKSSEKWKMSGPKVGRGPKPTLKRLKKQHEPVERGFCCFFNLFSRRFWPSANIRPWHFSLFLNFFFDFFHFLQIGAPLRINKKVFWGGGSSFFH